MRKIILPLALLLGLMTLSFIYEAHRAKTMVLQYVSIWEEDLARALITRQDSALLDKILQQLHELHSSVRQVELSEEKKLHCPLSNTAPITLYSVPAGQVRICYSSSELALRSLLSPIFMLSVFAGMGFIFFVRRREWRNQLQAQELRLELKRNLEIAEISRQVAHDIRGPLTALTALGQAPMDIPLEKKELLQMAVHRIHDIAEDLLQRSRPVFTTGATETTTSVTCSAETIPIKASASQERSAKSLAKICQEVLKEFEVSTPEISFHFENHLPQVVPTPLDSKTLKRILANLIQNAKEACPPSGGLIGLSLFQKTEALHITLIDNGKGIPEEILPQLGQKGMSHDKENGHGLGLYHAKKIMHEIQGHLKIISRPKEGTQVTLIFPR